MPSRRVCPRCGDRGGFRGSDGRWLACTWCQRPSREQSRLIRRLHGIGTVFRDPLEFGDQLELPFDEPSGDDPRDQRPRGR